MKRGLAAPLGVVVMLACGLAPTPRVEAQPPRAGLARDTVAGPMAADTMPRSVRASTPRDTLRLADVERMVLARNPMLEAAAHATRAARARSEVAGALEHPMVGLMVAPRSLGSDAVDPAYRVEVSQALPLFGQRGLRRRAATAEARATAYEERARRLEVLREARAAYFEYERVERARAINREQQALVSQLRRSALARYSAGLVGQQDPLQADMELAMLDHDAVELRRMRRVAVARLNALMRRPPAEELPPPEIGLAVPDTSFVHADLAPRARALRPELRAAAARVEARRADVALAGRSRLPEGAVSVAYDRFWTETELRGTVGLELGLPINLARVASASREARAMLAEAEAEREAAYLEIERQVEDAAAGVHETAHEIPIARDRLLPAAERALKAARAEYEAGRADFQTLISTARERARAQLRYHEALAKLRTAGAELERALGDPTLASTMEDLP